jgi:hypothetical protein
MKLGKIMTAKQIYETIKAKPYKDGEAMIKKYVKNNCKICNCVSPFGFKIEYFKNDCLEKIKYDSDNWDSENTISGFKQGLLRAMDIIEEKFKDHFLNANIKK